MQISSVRIYSEILSKIGVIVVIVVDQTSASALPLCFLYFTRLSFIGCCLPAEMQVRPAPRRKLRANEGYEGVSTNGQKNGRRSVILLHTRLQHLDLTQFGPASCRDLALRIRAAMAKDRLIFSWQLDHSMMLCPGISLIVGSAGNFIPLIRTW
jgi:hypothetical protein